MTKHYIGEIITEQGINYIVTDILDNVRVRVTPLREYIASRKVVIINGEQMTIADYLTQEEGRIMERWEKTNESLKGEPVRRKKSEIIEKNFNMRSDRKGHFTWEDKG